MSDIKFDILYDSEVRRCLEGKTTKFYYIKCPHTKTETKKEVSQPTVSVPKDITEIDKKNPQETLEKEVIKTKSP